MTFKLHLLSTLRATSDPAHSALLPFAAVPRPSFPLGLLIAGCLVICFSQGGATCEAAAPRPPKAWIDARGVCIFPLSPGDLPRTRQELADSLAGGWQHALIVPDPDKVVSIEGGRYPAVDMFRIDLTNATLHPTGKPERIRPNGRPETRLGVGNFHLVGAPLLCKEGKMNFDITASSVRLDVEHDRTGRPILLLADAKQAKLQFDAAPETLERLVLLTARDAAAPYGLTVVRTDLRINTQTARSLTVELHVLTKVGFIPAGMTFRVHVDIDEKMNARLTGLTCEGDEVLGPLIVGLLRPGLARYEGKTRPLISFPSDLRLRDVQVTVDDSVHLIAAFGS